MIYLKSVLVYLEHFKMWGGFTILLSSFLTAEFRYPFIWPSCYRLLTTFMPSSESHLDS